LNNEKSTWKMKKQNSTISNLDIKTTTGEPYHIPAEGSLGLLALGHIGLLAWREKRNAVRAQQLINKSK